jgi:hypothetical protein
MLMSKQSERASEYNLVLHRYIVLMLFLPIALSAQMASNYASPRMELADLLNDTLSKKVLVLGTSHLNVLGKSFNRVALDSLLAVVERYRPQIVAIEAMPPELIGSLENEGGNARVIVEAFSAKQIKRGQSMQQVLNTSRRQAQSIADSLFLVSGSPDISRRLNHIAYSLASYDYYSALLQWSYLPEEVRKHNDIIPDSVSISLNKDLLNANEITSLALPLAKTLLHQRVVSIDDHFDDLMLLPISDSLTSELKKHPKFQEVVTSRLYADSDSLLKLANANGNLLPYYLYLNSPGYMSSDIKMQWGLFLRTHLQSGLDRYRFTLWEIRNLKIASSILNAAPTASHCRILVIIGAAHKPFLDEYLRQMPDIQLLQLQDLL